MTDRPLISTLTVPLDGTASAEVTIDCGGGNLTLDALPAGEGLLAAGELQYYEEQGAPTHAVSSDSGRTTLTLTSARPRRPRLSWFQLPWLRLPWEACLWETEWQVHLNPAVSSGISAHTGGGNVRLNLGRAAVTRLTADTGGGNMDVILPERAADLSVDARSGAGNVTVKIGGGSTGRTSIEVRSGAGNVVVRVPPGLAARVHATSGIGKVTVPPAFTGAGDHSYQSPGYGDGADRVEITAHSGAGNVTVTTT